MTWLITIARYRAIDILRRAERETNLDDLPEPTSEETDGPASIALLSRDISLLDECMKALIAAERECVELAFYQGASHQEVSTKLSKPLGSVKTWIRRGLMNLKRCLTK